ncbi:MAG: ATP-binding cassette domain-containing protein, partial [Spirochaetales bacterium]
MGSAAHLEIEDLWIRYSSKQDPWIFQGVNLSVRSGQRILLTGPSGSGKSTLLYSMAGLIPGHVPAYLKGSIRLKGRRIEDMSPVERCQWIGMVFQDPETQFCTLTVEDELAFGLENLNLDPQILEDRISQVLSHLGLEHLRNRKISRLSGGEKQLVALASVLCLRPKLLLLDEVASNLDPDNARLVYHTLDRLFLSFPELSCICVEHRPEAVLSWITDLLQIDGKGKVQWGRVQKGEKQQGNAVQPVLSGKKGPKGEEIERKVSPNLRRTENTNAAPLLYPSGNPTMGTDCGTDYATKPAVAFCKKVSFTYPTTEGRQILQKVSIDLYPGEMVALLGKNGSGKTTLLKILIGALKPQSGVVRICGKDPTRMEAKQLANCCSFLFQNPEHQFIHDTVREELLQSLAGREEAAIPSEVRVSQLLEKVKLTGKENANPFELSTGEKRRLTVACALAVGSQIFLLDEPTFGQDPETTQQLGNLFLEIRGKGAALLMVTHDEEFAHKFADRILQLEELQELEQNTVLTHETPLCTSDNPKTSNRYGFQRKEFQIFAQYEQPSWLSRLNPLGKLTVSLFFMLISTFIFDLRLLAVWSLGAFITLKVLGRLSMRLIVRSTVPFFLLGMGFLWANLLFPGAKDPGETPFFVFGPLRVFLSSILFGLTMLARSVTFGLFSFLFVSTTDPMDFTVSLMKQAKLSPR